MASRHTGFANQPSHYPTSYVGHDSPDSEDSHYPDYKAPYDDLIDEYAVPYGSNTNPRSYTIESGDHRRQQSKGIGRKSTMLTNKVSEDTSEAAHFGYPPVMPSKEVDHRGFWEKILPESMACRLYVITVLLETAIDVTIESELLLRINRQAKEQLEQSSSKYAAYLSVFCLAHLFQFVLAVDAVYARNTLQFMFLTTFNALFLAYAVIQIQELKATTVSGVSDIPINVLTTIIPIVISIAEIAYIALGWKIYNEFGWKVYKFLGADRQIKKMYASYQIFECLVKFDVFFWVGFSIQFIWLVLNNDQDWEYYVTCAALPLSLVLLIEGHLAARHENKWMMATFMSGCVSALVYFIYKLAKVWINRNTPTYKPIYQTLTVFSIISIGLLITTFAFSIIVLRNFGRGLKGALEKKTQSKGSAPHNRAASVNLNRMSIN